VAAAALGAVQNITPSRGHDSWNQASGFPGDYVYSITQTADGYLWIGTNKGLLRYDGLNFVFIRRGDSIAAANEPVPGLVTDLSGQLWATDDHTHLFRYEAGVLKGPLSDNGRHQYQVSWVNKTFDGWLLFVSELQGVVEYRRGEAQLLLEARMVPSLPTAVAQTADGTVWIGTRAKGLFRLNPEKHGQGLQHVPSLANQKINCLLPIASTTLLIGTTKGLFALHNNKLISEVRSELGHHEILALANGRQGDVWIGTDGVVFKAHAKDIDAKGRMHSLEQLAVSGTVTALFEDRDGDLWIGEPESIERYRDSSFISYLSSAGLPCTNCGAIYVDPQQRVWFAPSDGGLFRISQGRVQSIGVAGLKDDIVYSITGADDEVWVARRYGGLTRLDVQDDAIQASTYSEQSGLAQDAVYSIFREPNGTVWAGTLNQGLSRFGSGTWHTFTTKDGLPSNRISVITGNAAGQIFIGTLNGLAEFRNDRWISYNTHDGLPPGAIESLFFDNANTLWIGTSRGIAFLRSGVVHVPVGAPNALYGDIVGMAESKGWLWIATPDHVLRVRSTALLQQAFVEGDYREFGVADGLPSAVGVKRTRSIVPDNRGSTWFSLNGGIAVLQPSAFGGPAFPATIRIDGMLVDGKLIATGDQIRIPSGRHRLTFQFAGVNVSNPEGVRYHYRLYDIDSAWSDPTPLRQIDFTNVSPGRFQFQVVARNPDGVWGPQVAAIAFEVAPSVLETRWFQVGIVGILALFALGVYQLRVQQLHRQFNIGLEARVNERMRIARELHDTLLQSFQGLLLRFQSASNLLPKRPEDAKRRLDDAIEYAAKAITEGRDAVHQIRSTAVITNDLASDISLLAGELAVDYKETTAPQFSMQVEGTTRDLHPIVRDEVYRIAAEAMRNTFKHSGAKRIEVEIRYGERELRLRTRDDGRGIDPAIPAQDRLEGHWGLSGMRERAKVLGGRLEVWSQVESGTEVELIIPAVVAYTERAAWYRRLFSSRRAA
jgi:signal transduction histidine kinase/ligand-binding sensor domain-containing protein